MTTADAYVILGLQESATADEVKSSFKKLALRTHPDKNPNDPEATKNFHRISEAYKRITDPSSFHDEDHEGADVSEEEMASTFGAMFQEIFMNGGAHGPDGIFYSIGSDDDDDDDEDSMGQQDRMDMKRAMEIMMNSGMCDEEDDDNEECDSEEDDENFGCGSDDDDDTKAAVYNLMASLTAGQHGGLAALFAGSRNNPQPAGGVKPKCKSDDEDIGQDSGLEYDDESDDEDDDEDFDPDEMFELVPNDGWDNNKMMQTVLKKKLMDQLQSGGGNLGLTAKDIEEGSFREVANGSGTVTMEFVRKVPGPVKENAAAAASEEDEWETSSEGDEEVTGNEKKKAKIAPRKASTNASATTAPAAVKGGTGAGLGSVKSAADAGTKTLKIPAVPVPAPVKSSVATSQKAGSSTKCVEVEKSSGMDDTSVLMSADCEDFAVGDRVCVNSRYVLVSVVCTSYTVSLSASPLSLSLPALSG